MQSVSQSSSSKDGRTNPIYKKNVIAKAYNQLIADQDDDTRLAYWLQYLNLKDPVIASNVINFIPDYQRVNIARDGFRFNKVDRDIYRPFRKENRVLPGRGNHTVPYNHYKLPGNLESRTLNAIDRYNVGGETHLWLDKDAVQGQPRSEPRVQFLSCFRFPIGQDVPNLVELEAYLIIEDEITQNIEKIRCIVLRYANTDYITPKPNLKTLIIANVWLPMYSKSFPAITELKCIYGPGYVLPNTLKRLHELVLHTQLSGFDHIPPNLTNYTITFDNDLNLSSDILMKLPAHVTNLTLNIKPTGIWRKPMDIPDTVVEFCCNFSVFPRFTSQSACKSFRLSESDTNVIGSKHMKAVGFNPNLDVLILKDKVYLPNKQTSKFEFQGLLAKPDFFEADVKWDGKYWSSIYEEIRD